MNTEHRFLVAAPRQTLWQFLMDVPVMASFIPGVEALEPLDASTYRGRLKVSVGPISVKFEGKVEIVDTNEGTYEASLRASGADNRLASRVSAQMSMCLNEPSEAVSELVIKTDVNIMGKLGDFGQAVLSRKADDLVRDFSARIRKKLETPGS